MIRRSWIGRGILCALAALLALAPGRASAAGGSLSYEDAVGEALRHSARLKVKKEEIHVNEASWRQSLSSLYPTLALNGRLERFGNLAGPTGIGTINGQVVGGLQDEWRSSVFVLGEYTLSNWFKKRYESHYYERLTEATTTSGSRRRPSTTARPRRKRSSSRSPISTAPSPKGPSACATSDR